MHYFLLGVRFLTYSFFCSHHSVQKSVRHIIQNIIITLAIGISDGMKIQFGLKTIKLIEIDLNYRLENISEYIDLVFS